MKERETIKTRGNVHLRMLLLHELTVTDAAIESILQRYGELLMTPFYLLEGIRCHQAKRNKATGPADITAEM